MLRFERHSLGPRVFILGRRIHEWHLGLLVIPGAVAAALVGRIGPGTALVASLLGAWLVVKDWPDLTRHGRRGGTSTTSRSSPPSPLPPSVSSTFCRR